MSRRASITLQLAVLALAAAGGGCGSSSERTAQPDEAAAIQTTASFATPQQRFALYEPPADEPYANGKRLAGRVAQQLATFPPRANTRELARGQGTGGRRPIALERTVAPLLDPERRSSGEVVYVQLSGVTDTTLGAMVLVRQHLENAAGAREVVERVMDVRLRRTDGPWSLDRIASVGGTAIRRPERISRSAARVLDHPNIRLPDTARWDIYRGGIDAGLLRALADAADRWRLAVMVLSTGHPPNVWAAGHPSAHSSGYAADIYAVDRMLVLRQRANGSSAQRLAAAFLAAGATQVGSPWTLPPGGRRSFTDRVHQDHIHVQQNRPSPPRG